MAASPASAATAADRREIIMAREAGRISRR
jgi:hypothetical protein